MKIKSIDDLFVERDDKKKAAIGAAVTTGAFLFGLPIIGTVALLYTAYKAGGKKLYEVYKANKDKKY